MCRAIIVDDEKMELDALSGLIVWKKHGIKIEQTFTNACDALEYMEENEIDVIFSDVSMPKMSGLDFLAQVREKFGLSIIFVFISAYSDFSYMQEAIHHNVFDYVLKPIDIMELDKMCSRIDDAITVIKTDDNNFLKMACQQALIDCINDKISEVEMETIFEQNNIRFKAEPTKSCVLCMEIADFDAMRESWNYTIDKLYLAIENVMNNNSCCSFIPLRYNDNKVYYLCVIQTQENNINLMELINEITDNCASLLKHSLIFSLISELEVFKNIRPYIKKM